MRDRLKEETDICFSHNDLLANNILLVDGEERVVFIDFEYSSYNYRCFDIANFFEESKFDYNEPHHPFFKLISDPLDNAILEDFLRIYSENLPNLKTSVEENIKRLWKSLPLA